MAIYAEAFELYRAAGWDGVLPLPARRKKNPPNGYTGRDGAWPSYADCYAWAEEQPNGNVCLRLPENVIGIDVDNYDDKPGGDTLARWVAEYGPLPATWRTGSRTDGVSGIRLYRVPAGLQWPGDLGGGIEIIQTRHRYAIVWPSVHPNGGTYRWAPEADTLAQSGPVPRLEELPELPAAWVAGLTHGRSAANIQAADLDNGQAVEWLREHGAGDPCRVVDKALDGYREELAAAARSRHEVAKDATMNLAHLAAEGHRGVGYALHGVRDAFSKAATDRTDDELAGEWARLLVGAVRIAAMDTIEPQDPCDNPWHGLLEQSPASPSALLGPTPARVAPQPAPAALPAGEVELEDLVDRGPAAAAGDETITPPAAAEEPAPSWRPVDLTPYLDGSWEPEVPGLLRRTDGHSLIYPGLVHSFHGESESGKSLVAQYLCAETMQGGQEVVYLDFESGPGPVVGRMLAMGCTPAQLAALFTYVRPEVNPYALAEVEAFKDLLGHRPALVILDGVTDALAQSGASSKDNDDITKWHRMIPRTISVRTGAAVILIDHVSKDTESRGRYAIGGQAKMNTLDGAAFSVEVSEPIGKGMKGKVLLRVGKDRPGGVRPHCGRWRASDRTQEAAAVVIDSTGNDGRIRCTVYPPASSVHMGAAEGEYAGTWRPTGLMERLSRALEDYPTGEAMNGKQLVGLVRDMPGSNAKATQLQLALDTLLEDGYLVRVGAKVQLRQAYRQAADPAADGYRAVDDMHALIDNDDTMPALPGMED